MTKKPIIGIIPDFKNGDENSYSTRPHYAIRKNYLEMLSAFQAVPIIIPYQKDLIQDYIKMLDGLLVIGGFFDINPKKYGEEILCNNLVLNETREEFEFEFVKNFLQTKLPILGICNGMQLMNVIYGGNLIQDILLENQTQNKNYINHEQSKIKGKEDSSIGYHKVKIVENSILQKIVKKSEIMTNSSHHQAIKNVAKSLEISAYAEDGIIEAIEDKNHKFCVGVQWHPEFNVSEADELIFQSFINSCK